MSIDIELALVLGLFILGAVVLAMDDQLDALRRRLMRPFLKSKSNSADERQSLPPGKKKYSNRSRLLKRDLTDGF